VHPASSDGGSSSRCPRLPRVCAWSTQGAALRLGYWLARARGAQVIVTIDADGQYEPAEISSVVAPIIAGQG